MFGKQHMPAITSDAANHDQVPLLLCVCADYAATRDYVCSLFQAASAAGLVVVAASGNFAYDMRGEQGGTSSLAEPQQQLQQHMPRLAFMHACAAQRRQRLQQPPGLCLASSSLPPVHAPVL
jgi:hypothetical protein